MTESLAPERYEALVEASPDAVLVVDADGVITYANARVADVFGYAPASLVGEPIEVLVPTEVRREHVAYRDAYLDDPERRPMGASLELAGRQRDGTRIPVDVSLSPFADADGSPLVMASVRDRRDREALEKQYQTILEAIPDAVVVADAATGELVEANEQVRSLFGYAPAAVLGEDQTVLHPSDEAARYRALFERSVAASPVRERTFPDGDDLVVETASGERVPVEIRARTFDLADRTLVAAVFRDVSDREERDRQLRELNAATRELLRADTREGIAHQVADAASSILGYASTVVRLVADGRGLVPVAVTEQARLDMGERPTYPVTGAAPASRAYATGDVLSFADVSERGDAYDRGRACASMYIPMGDHGVLSIVDTEPGAFDDADTELAGILAANAEAALDRLADERELERQNERLDEFVGVVSHDLRNPLGVAKGYLETARAECDAETLDDVATALDRMDAIITDTLTLAREGQCVADLDDLDLERLARGCWGMVATDGATIDVVDDVHIKGDRDRVKHVLENLFRNSVEHGSPCSQAEPGNSVEHGSASDRAASGDATGAGGVTVTVGALDDEDGFFVADDGPGIPESERETVFQSGYTTNPEGTGFGLPIVKQLAEAHGWRVRLTESESGGARFEFTGVERS
ncbi:PAS domain S-box protein [Halorubellus sp. PRR65]|uniref:PAS domain-containing sensor histidine kinase n=1 Tax=Halorubellus sp. PRR65 TaxID=3098148 RepID=UPI002B25B378|nr:PAS domain S-box protein [Halorubellus sp. PRR65]